MPTLCKRSNGFCSISFEHQGQRKGKSTGQMNMPRVLKEAVKVESFLTRSTPKSSFELLVGHSSLALTGIVTHLEVANLSAASKAFGTFNTD